MSIKIKRVRVMVTYENDALKSVGDGKEQDVVVFDESAKEGVELAVEIGHQKHLAQTAIPDSTFMPNGVPFMSTPAIGPQLTFKLEATIIRTKVDEKK